MAISVVGVTTASIAPEGASGTVALPSGSQPGDFLAIILGLRPNGTTAATITGGTGGVPFLTGSAATRSTNGNARVHGRFLASGEPATYTVTPDNTTNIHTMIAVTLRGVDTTSPWVVLSAESKGAATSTTSLAVTPDTAGMLILRYLHSAAANGSGMSENWGSTTATVAPLTELADFFVVSGAGTTSVGASAAYEVAPDTSQIPSRTIGHRTASGSATNTLSVGLGAIGFRPAAVVGGSGATVALTASIAPAATVSATLRRRSRMVASIAPAATVASTLRRRARMSASISPAATVSAALRRRARMSASIAAQATVSATLRRRIRFATAILAKATVSGTLSSRSTAPVDSYVHMEGPMDAKVVGVTDDGTVIFKLGDGLAAVVSADGKLYTVDASGQTAPPVVVAPHVALKLPFTLPGRL